MSTGPNTLATYADVQSVSVDTGTYVAWCNKEQGWRAHRVSLSAQVWRDADMPTIEDVRMGTPTAWCCGCLTPREFRCVRVADTPDPG